MFPIGACPSVLPETPCTPVSESPVPFLFVFPYLFMPPGSTSSRPPERQAEPQRWKPFLYSAPGRLRSQAHGEPTNSICALQDHVRQQKAEA